MSAKASYSFRIVRDNSAQLKQQLAANLPDALDAMGAEACSMILDTMQHAYWKDIYLTGALQRDVGWADNGSNSIKVGNTLYYGPFVHDGTIKMRARPYIRDSLWGRMGQLVAAAVPYLRKGITPGAPDQGEPNRTRKK